MCQLISTPHNINVQYMDWKYYQNSPINIHFHKASIYTTTNNKDNIPENANVRN